MVVDCRPVERRPRADVVKFDATARVCALVGWDYRLIGAADAILTANLRWLAGYRHPRHHVPEVVAGLRLMFATATPLMAGAEAVALAVVATSLSACGQNAANTAAPTKVAAVSAQASAVVSNAPASVRDLRFYSHLRADGPAVELVRQPASLAAAYEEATATIVAQVTDVRTGRTILDLQHIVVELRTTEVLQGALRPELSGKVLVEFPAAFLPDSTAPMVKQMLADIPKGQAVWLLRWEGEPPAVRKPGSGKDPTVDPTKHRTVHPNVGVFVQGPKRVISATAQLSEHGTPATDAQAEAEKLASLAELAAHARKSR